MSATEEFDLHELEEEHVEHADERWLISYSDMMTLLFGLFVLLYSMYDRFDVIQDSVSKKFGPEKTIEKHDVPKAEKAAKTDTAEPGKNALIDMQAKYLATQSELEKVEAKLKDTEAARDARIKELQSEQDELRRQLALAKLDEEEKLVRSRDPDNRPRPDDVPEKERRSDGLGGHGTRGAASFAKFHVKATLPDESVVEEDTTHIGRNGVELSQAPSVKIRDRIDLEITRNGQTINVSARPTLDDNGQISTRIRFLDFTGDGRSTLEQWLESR